MNMDPIAYRTHRIFQPNTVAKFLNVHTQNSRFVHYTTAEVAMSILRAKRVWMRNAQCMNDSMEMAYGQNLHVAAWNGEEGARLQRTLEDMFPGIVDKLIEYYTGWQRAFREGTYITCLSEHCPDGHADEDQIGRLSMWRAYCGATGVAIVVNNSPFVSESDTLKANTWPVNYVSAEGFSTEFRKFVDDVEQERDFLKSLGEDVVFNNLFLKFRSELYCTKHNGFKEEREWRVVYTPDYEKSEYIEQDICSVRGVPQYVQKIPLDKAPDTDLEGMLIPNLVERVIIGPMQFPNMVRDALIDLLSEAGVVDASNKVIVSDIPLRHNV